MSGLGAVGQELGQRPIPGGNPAGQSVRSDASFEELSDEVAKHESVTAGDVDWEKVVALSHNILAHQSKDLLVGVYYCRGVFDTQGFAGLRQGFAALEQMIAHYWSDLEPPIKRMRGRVAAFAWLMEKLTEAVEQRPAGVDQRGDADQCIQSLTDLAEQLSGHEVSLESAPLIRALRNQAPVSTDDLDEKPVRYTESTGDKELEAPAQEAAAPPPPAPAAAPASSSATPQKVDPELRRMIRRCADEMQKLASVWHERDLRDPRAYRFARLGAWSIVEKAPRNENGTVDLPPPPRNRLETVMSLYQQKRFPEFIANAEPMTHKHVFWLDGHRLIAAALNGMGEQFEPAARAVTDEVLAFVERIPEVSGYSFSDGTAFASPSTRAWIEQERAVSSAEGLAEEHAYQSGISEPWGGMAEKVSELADNGDFTSVAAMFSTQLAQAKTARHRFQWRLTEAGFYFRYGHDQVVMGIVEGLLNDAEAHNLAQWEPDLVQSLASLGVRCADRFSKADRTAQIQSLRSRSFELICRLDPGAALELGK